MPNLTKVQVQVLSSSESRVFILDMALRQTNKIIAKGLNNQMSFLKRLLKKGNQIFEMKNVLKKLKL